MTSIYFQDEQSIASSFTVDGARKDNHLPTRCDPTPSRRVGFVETVAVAEFRMYSPSMHENIWYSKDEYDMIKSRNSFIVSMVKQGAFKESEKHAFRGLEYKLREGYKQRKWNKITSIFAVLNEQEKQISQNTRNPEAIADVYRDATKIARESARINGEKDSKIDRTPVALKPVRGYQSPTSVPEDISLSIRTTERVSTFGRLRNRHVA